MVSVISRGRSHRRDVQSQQRELHPVGHPGAECQLERCTRSLKLHQGRIRRKLGVRIPMLQRDERSDAQSSRDDRQRPRQRCNPPTVLRVRQNPALHIPRSQVS